ncbi:DUF6801 domain-containing protein [Amycolatopsis suaedae]|uniref:DUF6801 domain-containing protein n=1 Tax=Amycolatopsis suaedae TaxID=2510978 RepID=A0A4Q7JBR8_9PSEU|nr:DUF6801 domain-containing protein [Amycolatopsis suaedae]RZQ64737.1 hypothetical protein EWH70_07570 [Amycolatopsis suaedae]
MNRRLGSFAAKGAALCMAAGLAAALGTGTALAADKVYETGDLAYTCAYPIIGDGPLTVHAKALGPDSVASGSTATVHSLEVVATVPEDIAQLLYNLAGVDGVRGDADADVSASGGTLSSPTAKDIAIPEQLYPGAGTFPVNALQDANTVIPTATAGPAPGPLTISLNNQFTVKADFHFLNSTPEWQAQDPFTCTLDPGQDSTLGSAPIT